MNDNPPSKEEIVRILEDDDRSLEDANTAIDYLFQKLVSQGTAILDLRGCVKEQADILVAQADLIEQMGQKLADVIDPPKTLLIPRREPLKVN